MNPEFMKNQRDAIEPEIRDSIDPKERKMNPELLKNQRDAFEPKKSDEDAIEPEIPDAIDPKKSDAIEPEIPDAIDPKKSDENAIEPEKICEESAMLLKDLEDGRKLMALRNTPIYEWPAEQLWELYHHDIRPRGEEEMVEDLRIYLKEIKESDGYDADSFPCHWGFVTSIIPIRDCYNDSRYIDGTFERLSKLAIENYNKKNGTKFGYHKVLKANVELFNLYYLTFHARERDQLDDVTFQARVAVGRFGGADTVEQCRIKHST